MKTTPQLPRVALIGCGGTITSLGTGPLDVMDYPDYGSKVSVSEVLARVPDASSVADIMQVPFRQISSSAITLTDWMELRAVIRDMAARHPELAGFVILHGTGTLEETAFFLDLTLEIPQTIVMVGSQRPLSAIGSDAPMNLIAALRVAGRPESRNRGVLVVLNDEIHAARDVTKTSTSRLQTFRSDDYGLLGVCDGDGVHFYRRTDRHAAPPLRFDALPDDLRVPRVDILYSYVGADRHLVDAAVAAGARGLVSAGTAPGIPAKAEIAGYQSALDAGLILVQCSRAPNGRVSNRLALAEQGWIAGGALNPQKARILLALGLSQTDDRETLRALFASY
jgi:L-asparaginase